MMRVALLSGTKRRSLFALSPCCVVRSDKHHSRCRLTRRRTSRCITGKGDMLEQASHPTRRPRTTLILVFVALPRRAKRHSSSTMSLCTMRNSAEHHEEGRHVRTSLSPCTTDEGDIPHDGCRIVRRAQAPCFAGHVASNACERRHPRTDMAHCTHAQGDKAASSCEESS
jgi:hypothetical protein